MQLRLILASLLLVPTTSAFALEFMKLDPQGANGNCLPPITENADAILARNSISIVNAPNKAAKNAVARIVGIIEKISAGKVRFEWRGQMGDENPTSFRYTFMMSDWAASDYSSDDSYIELRPNNQNMAALEDKSIGGVDNFAMLAHETAHYITMKDDLGLQTEYENSVKQPCLLTSYAKEQRCSTGIFAKCYRVEESAEVISAYLTDPDRLVNQGPACDAARKWVAALFGEPLSHSESCEARLHSL